MSSSADQPEKKNKATKKAELNFDTYITELVKDRKAHVPASQDSKNKSDSIGITAGAKESLNNVIFAVSKKVIHASDDLRNHKARAKKAGRAADKDEDAGSDNEEEKPKAKAKAKSVGITVSYTSLDAAARILFPDEVGTAAAEYAYEKAKDFAKARSDKAAAKKRGEAADKAKKQNYSKQAGLIVNPTRIEKIIRAETHGERVGVPAFVYLAAFVEHIIVEILDAAIPVTLADNRVRIKGSDIAAGIHSDANLLKAFPVDEYIIGGIRSAIQDGEKQQLLESTKKEPVKPKKKRAPAKKSEEAEKKPRAPRQTAAQGRGKGAKASQ